MTQDRNTNEPRRSRKPTPEWQKWIAGYAIVGVLLYAIAYLPVRPYRPFCDTNSLNTPVEFYGAHLNDWHRKWLRFYLNGTETLYVEIGDMIFVPLVEKGYDGPRGLFGLLLDGALNSRSSNWRQSNGKVEGLMPFYYAQDHPNSDIAKLYARYKAMKNYDSGSPEEIAAERLQCDLIKAVTDPALK